MNLLFLGGSADGQRHECGGEQFILRPVPSPSLYRRVKIEMRKDTGDLDPAAWRSVAWDVMLFQELPDEAAVNLLLECYASPIQTEFIRELGQHLVGAEPEQ